MAVNGFDHSCVVCDRTFYELVDHPLFANGSRAVLAVSVDSLTKEFVSGCEPYCADLVEIRTRGEFGPQRRSF